MSWTWPLGGGLGQRSATSQSHCKVKGVIAAVRGRHGRLPGGGIQGQGSEGEERGDLLGGWGRGLSLGGMKGASHLVLSPLLPEIHLVVQIWLGHTRRQLVRSIDNQDLLRLVEHQDRRGWLHWRKQNGTCQDLPQATEHACPCLQAGLLLTQCGDS